MLEHSHALRASKGHFSISEYFLPFSPSLTRRGYLSLPKACQILLREVSDLIDGAGLVRRPSYSLFRAIISLPSLPWQMEDGLLALFYIFKSCFQALHPLFHLPCPKKQTEQMHSIKRVPWHEGKVGENESQRALRGFSDPGCSLPWRSNLRWGAEAEWILDHKGLEEPVWSLLAGYTLLSIVLSDSPLNFLPACPSLYRSLHDRDWGMSCTWVQLKTPCGLSVEVYLLLSMWF